MSDLPQYLTPPQFAQQLGCKPETVRAMIRDGRLRAVRIGQGKKRPRLRIPREAIEEFNRGRLHTANTETPRPQPRRRTAHSSADVKYF